VHVFIHVHGCRHGDLKAGNVLLTVNTALQHACGGRQCGSSSEVFVAAGSPPLTAKVGDFGLALPLGPQDTHATMMARVSALGVCGLWLQRLP
jgi:serine/threonine protein kinase